MLWLSVQLAIQQCCPLWHLKKHSVLPNSGPVPVTGANGGVGSFAIAFLACLGYEVIASTGRPDKVEYITKLGASAVIHRDTLSFAGKLLAKEQWAGAIDSVGSHTLANVCAGIRYGGTVAACGLAIFLLRLHRSFYVALHWQGLTVLCS